MKYSVCSLFLALFIVTLIASCDSSTGPDPAQRGVRVGSFMVYNIEAEWVGVQSKSKLAGASTQAEGDTITYDQPDGNAITVRDEGDVFTVAYIDSAFNKAVFDTTEAGGGVKTINPLFDQGGAIWSITEDYFYTSTNIKEIPCDSTYNAESDHLEIIMVNDSQEPHKAIHVNVSGLEEAVKTLRGCN